MKHSIHPAGALVALVSLAFAVAANADTFDWTQQEAVADNGAANNGLGRGAAILGDTAFVAATNAPAGGAVYVFTRGSDGVWTQTQQLNATESPDGADFGCSIALSADTAVIGADRTTLTDDGNRHQGAVYVFARGKDGTWTQTQKLTADDFSAEAQFGDAVALSGSTILIGAYNATIDENPYQGAAYVFTLDGGSWTQTQKLVADDGIGGDDFGNAVALDGTRALVGAFYGTGTVGQSGAAYVFEGSGSSWKQTAKLVPDDGAFFDSFGSAVVLSGDSALVGSLYAQIGDNSGQGAVYAFDFAGGSWSQTQKLVASDGAASDALGNAMARDGDQVLVGANAANGYVGAAYLFARGAAGWSELGKLVASDGASGDGFGYTVALSGDTALAGAPLKAVGANSSQGAAYFYTQAASDDIFADGFDGVSP
jgi:hypothetical protein